MTDNIDTHEGNFEFCGGQNAATADNDWNSYADHFLTQAEKLYQNAKDSTNSLANQYVDSLATIGGAALKATRDLSFGGVLRLFDGDKPLEIDHKPKPSAKQEWVVAMYIATDFSNECTIEKRTKKLQELAAQTADKPVTIVVQTANKGKDGKFTLERFVLKDGKVTKLGAPGQTKGYADDVEGLLKFTTKNYESKNLALTLDSHGSGNGGLHGDVGDMSLANLSKAVKNGLKGTGHEKLDLLQFDACLMAQNGVLESTSGITRHLVASAEPEGTGADAAGADNKQLLELLKKPSMTAGELADIFVAQSKDNTDFKTLAHFDMERYETFRKSLDSFGEKLAKLCEDPENLKVIRELIKETFAYGKFSFGSLMPGIGILPGAGGMLRPEWLNGITVGGHKFSSSDLSRPESVSQLLFGPQSQDVGSTTQSGFLGLLNKNNSKRDLKDFVAKVLVAISKGKLKDEDGTLRMAAHSVLYEGTMLTKSYYGRDDRKNLGGLSAFLPSEPNNGGASDPVLSTTGGWRQFQQILRTEKGKKP